MGQTTWHPRTNYEKPRQWLLTNGDVVSEPALEQTTSGRKVRVAGTDLSAFSKDMDELILRAVDEFATAKGAETWMPLHDHENLMTERLGFDPAATQANLHVLSQDLYGTTTLWWRFRHPSLPIEAMISLVAKRTYPGHAQSTQDVTTTIVAPYTHVPEREEWRAMEAQLLSCTTPNLREFYLGYNGQRYTTAAEFIRDNPPAWASILDSDRWSTDRQVVENLLVKARKIDELETIEVPDFRDFDNPGWLELELYDTNCHPSFFSELTEYLEGTPTLEEALRLYGELQRCLRGIGLVMEDKGEGDFQRALLNGDGSGITVDVGPIAAPAEDGGQDHDHTLSVHLATGTFVVNCSAHVNYGEIAERWDEALTVASLSGQEDTLLAFAREAARQGHTKRVRKTIRERKNE